MGRVRRVGVFKLGTDRVRALKKTTSSGTDRVRVLAPHRVLSGIENIDWVFFIIITRDKVFLSDPGHLGQVSLVRSMGLVLSNSDSETPLCKLN